MLSGLTSALGEAFPHPSIEVGGGGGGEGSRLTRLSSEDELSRSRGEEVRIRRDERLRYEAEIEI